MDKKGLKLLLFLLLMILSAAIAVAGNESIELNLNEEKTVSGVSIHFNGLASSAEAMLKFNGKTVFVKRGEVTKVSGMTVTLDQVLNNKDETKVWITVSIPFVCGDNVCGENEKNYCCSDCGCPNSYECTEDQCIKAELNECNKNSDCKPTSSCEKGSCEGAPRKCVYKKIDECRSGDKCCPTQCTSYAKDNDCKQYIECTKQEECDDKNSDTNDYCSIPDAKCYHTKVDKKKTEQNLTSTANPSNMSSTTNASSSNITGDLKNPETFKSSKETILLVVIILLVLILVVFGILFYLKSKKDKRTDTGYVVPEKVVVQVKDKPALETADNPEIQEEPEEHPLTKEEKESLKEPVIIKKDEYQSYEKVHEDRKRKEAEKEHQKKLEEEKKKAKLHPLLKKVEEHNKKVQEKHPDEKTSKNKK